MKKLTLWFMATMAFLLLTGCQVNPEIVENLEELATPTNCYWHGIDVPPDAVHTGVIVKKTDPKHIMGKIAAVERECGDQYPFKIGGCVKPINGEKFPSPDHLYEIVFIGKCAAIHEACHALFEVGDERQTLASFIRMIEGDQWWACPPTVHSMPWRKVVLPELTDDDYRDARFHEELSEAVRHCCDDGSTYDGPCEC